MLSIFRRKLVGPNESIEKYQMMTLNPNFKGAAVGPLSEAIYANQQNYKNFTFRVLPEVLLSVPMAMFFPKKHFLADEFSHKINILNSAGLIDKWMSNYLIKIPPEDQSAHPKKLTIDQLTGGIYLYLGGTFISLISFIIERNFKVLQRSREI